jgi:hypothetical protein
VSVPDRDPRLESIIEGLEATGWAAEVCDAEWRLVWVSSQTRALIGQQDDSGLGLGKHKAVRDAGAIPVTEVPCERS